MDAVAAQVIKNCKRRENNQGEEQGTEFRYGNEAGKRWLIITHVFEYYIILSKGENRGVMSILWRIGFHRTIVCSRGSAAFLLCLSEGVCSRLSWVQATEKEQVSEGFRLDVPFFQVVKSLGFSAPRGRP